MLPMVVVAVLWSFVYNPDFGLVNAGLAAVGLEELQRVWLGDTSTALLAVSLVSGWVFAGFYMMIFYAAFRQIPSEAVEAARLDGAGEWALFSRIKVPMIRSVVWVTVLLCVTGGFQGFDLFFVLTNGGPYGATEIPTTYLVKTVFRNGDVGYGSAMAVILTAIVLGVGLVYARLQAPRPPGGSGVSARRAHRPAATPAGRAAGPPGVGGAGPAGAVLLLPADLDDPVQLQDQRVHLLDAVRATHHHRLRPAGRGLGGGQHRPVRAQQHHHHAACP